MELESHSDGGTTCLSMNGKRVELGTHQSMIMNALDKARVSLAFSAYVLRILYIPCVFCAYSPRIPRVFLRMLVYFPCVFSRYSSRFSRERPYLLYWILETQRIHVFSEYFLRVLYVFPACSVRIPCVFPAYPPRALTYSLRIPCVFCAYSLCIPRVFPACYYVFLCNFHAFSLRILCVFPTHSSRIVCVFSAYSRIFFVFRGPKRIQSLAKKCP